MTGKCCKYGLDLSWPDQSLMNVTSVTNRSFSRHALLER